MRQPFLIFAAALAFAFLSSAARASACGEVTLAEMNWSSAAIAAQVDKIVLEKGFGCEARVVPGDTIPTFDSMLEQSYPDVASELWVNSINERLTQGIRAGKLVEGAEILADGAVEGWWIPKFIADAHPEILTVQKALNHPELFGAEENGGTGTVHNCPAQWACRTTTANLFKALGAEGKGFRLENAASGEALEETITRAFEEKKGWLGYYWAPTGILGRFQMVKLSFDVPFDQLEWDSCTSIADCPNPKVNSYPTSQAFTVMTKPFVERVPPEVSAYLRERKWSNATVSATIAWKEENKATSTEAAMHFFRENIGMWTRWVSPEAGERIKAELNIR